MLFYSQDLGVIFSLLSFPLHPFVWDQQCQSCPASAHPLLEEGSRAACPSSFLVVSGPDSLPLSRCIGFLTKSSALLARLCRRFVLQPVGFSLCSGVDAIQLSWPNSWTFHYVNAGTYENYFIRFICPFSPTSAKALILWDLTERTGCCKSTFVSGIPALFSFLQPLPKCQ